jgi:hypothetical protein
VKLIYTAITISIITVLGSVSLLAQETEETVIDEVVAQVNDDVITLSQVKREKKNVLELLMAEGKSREEAEKTIVSKEGELIANLITTEMMRQKGVEMGLDKQVETEINRRLLKLVKDNKLKTVNDLYAIMRTQKVDPEGVKANWRSEIMKQQVMFQMVDLVVYWETSDQEVKDFFAANKEKFLQQEQITVSEIFLSFSGKDEAEVTKLANSLVLRLRAGEDFVELAKQYSDRPEVAQNNGLVGTFEVSKLNDDIQSAVKGLKSGGIGEPIRWDIGIEIVRVDNYVPASTASNFDESQVRQYIMREKAPKARVKFIQDMREDSYIKIRENYRGIVSPFLVKSPVTETEKPKDTVSKAN